ncbi:MAG: hypothetical protein V7767_07725 [Leeuwenhoekiella sp.]
MKKLATYLTAVSTLIIITACENQAKSKYGIFEGSNDIGNVTHKGSIKFNASDSSYAVTGGGANMWFDHDEFYYVWKKMSGDVAITADINWPGTEGDAHKKACLIFRQTLDSSSAYADAVVHGDGLTSMQYRESKGAVTREIQSNTNSPQRIRIEKQGDYFSMSIAFDDENLKSSGGSFKLPLNEPFYIGLGVSSHNNDTLETAIFSNVKIEKLTQKPDSSLTLESTLEVIPVSSFDRRVVYHTSNHIEAPNWSPDGKTLIYNSDGLLYKIPVEDGEPQVIPSGFAEKINNDHGISPDGKNLAISDQTETGQSMIYLMPISGGDPKKLTSLSPSYWHGWSPDGSTIVYCAERNGNYDVYSMTSSGGKETRLTTAEGLDDGPEYSPDGKYIYFNSVRSGTMQIWRMHPNGSNQEQITTDDYNDWFAHPSPDGKWIAYVTFNTDIDPGDHPANKDVMLRLMNLDTKEVQIMAKLFGGQGTMNVPSWSSDSQKLAFVSYRLK